MGNSCYAGNSLPKYNLMNTVVHIVCSIDRGSNIQTMGWIIEGRILLNWKLSCFLKFLIDLHSLCIQFLLDDFIFNKALCFFEIVNWVDYFRVGWHDLFFDVEFLSPDPILCPSYKWEEKYLSHIICWMFHRVHFCQKSRAGWKIAYLRRCGMKK